MKKTYYYPLNRRVHPKTAMRCETFFNVVTVHYRPDRKKPYRRKTKTVFSKILRRIINRSLDAQAVQRGDLPF